MFVVTVVGAVAVVNVVLPAICALVSVTAGASSAPATLRPVRLTVIDPLAGSGSESSAVSAESVNVPPLDPSARRLPPTLAVPASVTAPAAVSVASAATLSVLPAGSVMLPVVLVSARLPPAVESSSVKFASAGDRDRSDSGVGGGVEGRVPPYLQRTRGLRDWPAAVTVRLPLVWLVAAKVTVDPALNVVLPEICIRPLGDRPPAAAV